MTLKLCQKTKRYVAVVRTANGKSRTIKTFQTSKEEALKILRESKVEELERAALVGALTNEAISLIQADKKVTLAVALTEWLDWLKIRHRPTTANDYEMTVRAWLTGVDMEKSSPRVVEERHVHDWINDPEWKAKANTRMTKLAAIKSFCEFCLNENYMSRDPAARVFVSTDTLTHAQKEPGVHTIFTEEEVEKLAVTFEPGKFWHVAIALGRYAGLRIGDVCRLEWESFQTPGVLMVWTHKRNKPVKVPIHPKLDEALKALETHEHTFVFPSQHRLITDVKKRSELSNTFTRACRRLGIHGKSFHDLRRTFCTVQAQNGVSTKEIGKLVGHSHEATTDGYIVKSSD